MGLSFLTPMLLAGAALVAVPIVLHLIMRRKPVKREFPALRFLQEKSVANRRRLRFSHLLLLLLRMAALVFLALCLARPVLRGAGWLADGEGPVAAVFVFDTAPRMLLREGNRTRLEQAALMARVLFEKLPPLSKVAVLDTAGSPAAFSPTIAAAAARIDRLAVATPSRSLSAAMVEGLGMLDGSKLQRHELYVFTDCSQGQWNGTVPPDVAVSHPETSVLYIDVGAVAPQNCAIESLALSGETIAVGMPLSITATTSRMGPDISRALAVEMLSPDGTYARRAIKPFVWKKENNGQVDFEISGLEPGVRQGRIVIDGSDDLEADNQRSFTVVVGAPARVLVAAPTPAARTGLFLSQAIAPAVLRKSGKVRFDVTLIDTAQLEATSWDDYRGIVLLDPPPLPPRTWELLAQWLAQGRGLVVWLGPRASDAQRFNSETSQKVLGGRIVRVWRSPDGSNFLAPLSLNHPILSAFRRVGDAVPWQDFPVVRHWEFSQTAEPATGADNAGGDAAGEQGTASVVVAYRNGLPAVLENRVGRGDVVIVTTPVSQAAFDPDAWNTLASGFEPWPFVMLANETLLQAIDISDNHNIVTGQPAILHLERRDVATVFVHTPAGDDVPVVVDQKRGTISVTATQSAGNYTIRSGGDTDGIAEGLSANFDAAATDCEHLEPQMLAGLFGEDHHLARTEADLVRDVNLERIGAELYGWLIVLVALLMVGDWIVANRFYAPRESTAGEPQAATAFAEATDPTPSPPPLPAPPPLGASGRMPGPPPLPTLHEAGA